MATKRDGDAAEAAQSEKRKQYSVWFLPSVYKRLQHEAIDREKSVGEVIEEVMGARMFLISKDGVKK